jgi:putative FmdB family regulatory protein
VIHYDYICQECDHRFDDYIESNKSEPIRCPNCDSLDVKRQFPMSQMVMVKGSPYVRGS